MHTQYAQQSYCFGNFPRERGLVITFIHTHALHHSGYRIILDRTHKGKKKSTVLSDFGSDIESFVLANLDWICSAPAVYIRQ